MNRYYNSNTELFARSVEFYIKDKEIFKLKAPILYKKMSKAIETNRVPELAKLIKIVKD
jgi:hypothetical protein